MKWESAKDRRACRYRSREARERQRDKSGATGDVIALRAETRSCGPGASSGGVPLAEMGVPVRAPCGPRPTR